MGITLCRTCKYGTESTKPLDRSADSVAVAALVNYLSSSWVALTSCAAIGGCGRRNVLVLGATGVSGWIAVTVAHSLGAARVVGMVRNYEKLANVKGLNEHVLLKYPLELPQSVGPLHVVLDYIKGSV